MNILYTFVWVDYYFFSFLQKQSIKQELVSHAVELGKSGFNIPSCHVEIPGNGNDVWEIDADLLEFEYKINAGSNGDMWVLSQCFSFNIIFCLD